MKTVNVPNIGQLRLPRADDVRPLYEIVQQNKQHLVEWQRWIEQVKSRAHIQYFIDSNRREAQRFFDSDKENEQSTHPGFQLLLVNQNGQILGMIGFQGIHLRNRIVSLGYWIAQEYQGKGLITQSVKALVDYCFTELDINRIEIQCSVENEKSQGVPERLSFKREARLSEIEYKEQEDRFVDHYLYRMLKSDWQDEE